ncbi:MAG TPA: hypothetical protein VJZ25_06245, partial [Gemmatimonadaceae bacterium]|nr:hypothetical protein [Gemmatimonadaceae bacterium]
MTRALAAPLSIAGLALAASAASVANGFAFDDVHIIATNPAVHSLTRWWELFAQSYWPPEKSGELYRPFTMLSFAAQWALGGGSPLVFHLTSVLLYALTCSAFLWVAMAIVPLAAAWLAAALFAVHPLHVEVVGNVVCQAELWAALFMFVALGVFLRARIRGFLSPADISVIVLSYGLGLLSKEHVIVLPLVLIAAELTVVPRTRALRVRVAELRPLFLMCAAGAIAYLWARSGVLAQSRGIPPEVSPLFSGQPFGVRALTMLRVVLEWTRLFLWPARLSADYSPRRIDLATGLTVDMVVSVGIIALLLAVAWKARRSAPAVTFAVLWLATAMLIPSNLVVVTGFVLAERTLFVASAPIMLGVALAVTRLMAAPTMTPVAARRGIFAAIAIVLAVGIVASGKRQRVWRDNTSLFPQMVRDAPTSYKARHLYAILLFEQGKRTEGLEQIRIAHQLFPADVAVLHYSGAQRAEGGQCHVATPI